MNTIRIIIVAGILFVSFLTFIIGCILNEKKVFVHSYDKTFISKHTGEYNKLLNKIEHYWTGYDFSDSLLVANTDISEQAFVNFIVLIANTSPKDMCRIIDNFYSQSASLTFAYNNFIMLAEKYLYNPNSPYRNEDIYIPVLEHIINNPKIDSLNKIRPKYQLEMTMKNRKGEKSANFKIMLTNNRNINLHDINAEFIILFFNNPNCPDCKRVKDIIISSKKMNADNIKVVSVYIDDELDLWRKAQYPSHWINGYNQELSVDKTYDLKAIPTLYLLDKDKRVILKDSSIELINQYFVK